MVAVADLPPRLATVIDAVPAVAMRAAGTVAVSCVAETKAVASGLPFHFTVEPETKFVPFTVSVNCAPHAAVHVGLSEVMIRLLLIVITTIAQAMMLVP